MITSVLERPTGDRRDTARTDTTISSTAPTTVPSPRVPRTGITSTLGSGTVTDAGAGIQVVHRARLERERYEELLALPTDALRERAAEEIRAELAMDPDRQREAIHIRLTAWLDLDAEDARIVARVWDEAAAQLSAEEARRRFEAECDAMLHGFRFADFTRFAEFIPWVRSYFGLALFGSMSRHQAAA